MDLVDYVNQDILGITQLENRALADYAAVTGKNYTNDQALLAALNDQVIPLYKRFLDLLRKVAPRQQEIAQLHALYVSGAEDLYAGFNLIRTGVEQADEHLVRAANSKIENGRKKTERWRAQLLALYEAHGVKSAAATSASPAERQLIDAR